MIRCCCLARFSACRRKAAPENSPTPHHIKPFISILRCLMGRANEKKAQK